MIALEVANDAFEERGDSTGLRESLDTIGAPREENNDLTNNNAIFIYFLFTSIIDYSIGKFVLNKYI